MRAINVKCNMVMGSAVLTGLNVTRVVPAKMANMDSSEIVKSVIDKSHQDEKFDVSYLIVTMVDVADDVFTAVSIDRIEVKSGCGCVIGNVKFTANSKEELDELMQGFSSLSGMQF